MEHKQEPQAQRKPLLKIREACRITGFSPPFLYAAMERADLPYIAYRRTRRIDPDELDRFIAKHTVREDSAA